MPVADNAAPSTKSSHARARVMDGATATTNVANTIAAERAVLSMVQSSLRTFDRARSRESVFWLERRTHATRRRMGLRGASPQFFPECARTFQGLALIELIDPD